MRSSGRASLRLGPGRGQAVRTGRIGSRAHRCSRSSSTCRAGWEDRGDLVHGGGAAADAGGGGEGVGEAGAAHIVAGALTDASIRFHGNRTWLSHRAYSKDHI